MAPPSHAALVVTPFIWEGGHGRGKPTVHHLLQGLKRAGFAVHVVCATNRRGQREAVIDGVHVHYFWIPFTGGRFDFDAEHSFLTAVRAEPRGLVRHLKFRAWWLQFVILGSRRALGVSRRLEPAVTYGVNNPGVPAAWIAGRSRRVPVVARVMGSEIAQYAGLQPGVPNRRPGLASRVRVLVVRFDELLAFRLPCDAWLVTDDGQIGRTELTGWLGVPPERLYLWRNGVDPAWLDGAPNRAAARAELGVPGDAKVVLWVSQLTDWKHPERLLEAVPEVLRHIRQAVFLFVGDGPERSALADRAKALGVEQRVRLCGFVPHERMPLYYRAADVFTALYDRANAGNTLLEAMRAGLAVVTLDNGLTREAVTQGVSGLLVPPEKLDLVAAALVRVLGDDELRGRLSSGAASWAEANLVSWRERIDREVAVIQSLIEAGERRH